MDPRQPPPFRQLLHLLPGTECRSERHYLFSSCQFFQPLAYQRDSLQITDPRYTPDNKLGPLPGSHGHGFIAGHPASLTPPPPTGPSRPVGWPACSSPQHRDCPGTITRPGGSVRRMTLLNHRQLLLPKIQTPQAPQAPESIQVGPKPLGLSALALRCWCSQAFLLDVCLPEKDR